MNIGQPQTTILDVNYNPNSLNEYNRPKRKLTTWSQGVEQWLRSYFYPILFRIATLGLYCLFFLFKIFLLTVEYIINNFTKFTNIMYTTKDRKRVIIVGGGYAGVFAAKELEENFEVTLIDTKDFYEFTPSRLRTLVEPHHSFKVQIKYREILKHSNLVVDKVSHVTKEGVYTVNNDYMSYDYLVVCTGSRYKESLFPVTQIDPQLMPANKINARVLSARVDRIDSYNKVLAGSRKVLVIGGGTVGVELAGEIIEHFPEKEVVIIQSQNKLINRSPEYAVKYAENYFKKNNVTVITGERIVSQNGPYFQTDLGTMVEADLAFVCTGNVPNSEVLLHEFPQHLNKYGFVKVNRSLHLEGQPNIFVAGDITDIPNQDEKLCQTACEEIKVVIRNIYNSHYQKPLREYKPSPCPMLISLGKYDAIFTYKSYSFAGFIPAVMKEFVEWKEMVFYWNWSHFHLSKHQKFLDDFAPAQGHSHIV